MTNRLKQAWLALCARLEPVRVEVEVIRELVVEKPVIGEAHRVKLYQAKRQWLGIYDQRPLPEWHGNIYLTCEQAHGECAGAEVISLDAVAVGGVYLRTGEAINVQTKPKVAKGKRNG
jgi:hypothetical protein